MNDSDYYDLVSAEDQFDPDTSQILSEVLRGEVGFAYARNGWITLMYPKEKRALKINTAKNLVLETDYYERMAQ